MADVCDNVGGQSGYFISLPAFNTGYLFESQAVNGQPFRYCLALNWTNQLVERILVLQYLSALWQLEYRNVLGDLLYTVYRAQSGIFNLPNREGFGRVELTQVQADPSQDVPFFGVDSVVEVGKYAFGVFDARGDKTIFWYPWKKIEQTFIRLEAPNRNANFLWLSLTPGIVAQLQFYDLDVRTTNMVYFNAHSATETNISAGNAAAYNNQ